MKTSGRGGRNCGTCRDWHRQARATRNPRRFGLGPDVGQRARPRPCLPRGSRVATATAVHRRMPIACRHRARSRRQHGHSFSKRIGLRGEKSCPLPSPPSNHAPPCSAALRRAATVAPTLVPLESSYIAHSVAALGHGSPPDGASRAKAFSGSTRRSSACEAGRPLRPGPVPQGHWPRCGNPASLGSVGAAT